MLRIFDVLLSVIGLLLFFPLLVLLFFACFLDTGKPLFAQQRVGMNRIPYTIYKFRTMSLDTKDMPTHNVSVSKITSSGRFLRASKLDELPQLVNVLFGHMSFVGPRPCLLSQHEVIDARDRKGVYRVRPGITGLSQLSGVDMSTPELLAETDSRMLAALGAATYFEYIFFTLIGRGYGDRVK